MITEQKAEQMLIKIAETDDQLGELAYEVGKWEHMMKTTDAFGFIHADGTVAERKSLAITSEDYQNVLNKYLDAKREYETLKAKRKSWELVWETWRTQEASRRKGA